PESYNQMIAYRHKVGKRGMIKVMSNFSIDNSSIQYRNLDTKLDDRIFLKNNDLFIVSTYKGVAGKDWVVNSGVSFNFDDEKIKLNENDIKDTKQSYELKFSLTKPVTGRIKLKFGANFFNKDFSRDYLPVTGDPYKWQLSNPIIATFVESEIKSLFLVI
ncbi:MAG: hypothetical protein Q7J06_00130, partial [Bacteroidales bacterium]|nr:hypothetical protein [Bacteroidales bacterium]